MKYQYSVTLEKLALVTENSITSLQFEIESHDDVFEILERLDSNSFLDESSRGALVVGIKSLGYAIMSNKDSEAMAKFLPHFKELMKELKKSVLGNVER